MLPILNFLLHFRLINIERNHLKSFLTLLARANVSTVFTALTIKYRNLNAEFHTFYCLRSYCMNRVSIEISRLCVVKDERTNSSVWTRVGTFITLYTVLAIPYGYKCLYTTFLIGCCSILPSAVYRAIFYEIRHF